MFVVSAVGATAIVGIAAVIIGCVGVSVGVAACCCLLMWRLLILLLALS